MTLDVLRISLRRQPAQGRNAAAKRERQSVIDENVALSRVEAEVYDANHFEIFHPWEQARLRRDLRRYAGRRRVLDVGAGTGNVVTKVAAAHRIALDLSPEMLGQVRPRAVDVVPVVGLADGLPFEDASFDLITAYSTLHHLPDWSALAEMSRVLRPGGAILLDHEEAFIEAGWRRPIYDAMRRSLRAIAAVSYWRRPQHRVWAAYRRVHWPLSETLGPIDFWLTDGAHPDPQVIEQELRGLGLRVTRRHYLLVPLPMCSVWQRAADAACRRFALGHFSIEATR